MEFQHIHCLRCFNRRCMTRPEAGVSCDLISCPHVCGAVFHSCKLEEHRALCPYEWVPCLNTGFGCPFTLARFKMAEHLATCPASVVCCTMEWNRWPVSYADRKSYEILSKDFDEVEQLDMALALQDQRMLLESLRVTTTIPNSALGNGGMDIEDEPYSGVAAHLNGENGSMRNGANHHRLNGAGAPENVDMRESVSDSEGEEVDVVGGEDLPPGWWVRDVVGDERLDVPLEDAPYAGPAAPYRPVPVIHGEINGAMRNGANHHRLNGAGGLENVDMRESDSDSEGEEVDVVGGEDLPLGWWVRGVVADEVAADDVPVIPDEPPRLLPEHIPIEVRMSQLSFSQRTPNSHLFRIKMADKAVDTSDLEVADDPMGLHGIDLITAALLFCLGDSPGGRGISDIRFVDGYHIDFGTQTFSFPSAILATNTTVGDIGSASACDHASPQLSNPSPFHTLRLDLVLDCVARYQTKQRSMFTFVCGQLFRRSEFSSHFKNVHGDIHAGLNGWMEHRCPLAYYGCTYSQRRFCPAAQGSRVIHDRHLGSFGVQLALPLRPGERPLRSNCCFGAPCDHFSSLPFEILQHIASFLDGFSLCQLSRASHGMREVCASLLLMRGMVVMLWGKKQLPDGSSSWQITDKVWRFSTAFSTVTEWKFANISSMADHLKKCTFNTVTRSEDAVPLPCMSFTRELTKDGRCLRSVLKPVS